MRRIGTAAIAVGFLLILVKGNDFYKIGETDWQEYNVYEGDELELKSTLLYFNARKERAIWEFQGQPLHRCLGVIPYKINLAAGRKFHEYALKLVNVSSSCSGTYTFSRSNQNGTNTTSFYVVIKKAERPRKENCPRKGNSFLARQSEQAHLLCTTECMHSEKASWLKRGVKKLIKANEKYSILQLKNASVLVIKDVNAVDYGSYTCFGGKQHVEVQLEEKVAQLPITANPLEVGCKPNSTLKNGQDGLKEEQVNGKLSSDLCDVLLYMLLICLIGLCCVATKYCEKRYTHQNHPPQNLSHLQRRAQLTVIST